MTKEDISWHQNITTYNKTFLKKSTGNWNELNFKMNNPVYLGLYILDISKIGMYKYWYDYVQLKHGKLTNYATWTQRDIYVDLAG